MKETIERSIKMQFLDKVRKNKLHYLFFLPGFYFLLFSINVFSQNCVESIPESTPVDRYQINEYEVFDTHTGLIWQRCPLGLSGIDCVTGNVAEYTWSGSLLAAQNVRIMTGKQWRLPNLNELRSIIEEACVHPAVNLSVFPNMDSFYWSGSPYVDRANSAWSVYFDTGYSYAMPKDTLKYVRLVRYP